MSGVDTDHIWKLLGRTGLDEGAKPSAFVAVRNGVPALLTHIGKSMNVSGER